MPDEPLVPLIPEVPEEPLVPELPELPDVPEDPEEPEVPEEPLVPEEPDVPEEPLVPLSPDVPDDPLVPELPLDPEVPAISVVKTLKVSVSPELLITSHVPTVLPVKIGNADIFWFDILINILMLVLNTVIVFGCHNVIVFIKYQKLCGW